MPSFMIDEKKNLVESQGFLLDERKNLVKDQGYVIDEKKNLVEYQIGEIIPPNPPVIEEFEDMIKKSYSLTGRGTTTSLGFTFNDGDELANDVKSNNFILAKIKFSNFGGSGDVFAHDTPVSVDIMNNSADNTILILHADVQFYFALADFTLWINNSISDTTLATMSILDVYNIGDEAINTVKQALASANITIDVYLES